MAEAKEPFLERWSRRKREQATPAAPQQDGTATPDALAGSAGTAAGREGAVPAEPVPLPPVESLTPDSDFAPFMNPKVPELMRRAALKKLFQDPRYNVVDKFEAYWEDFTKDEGIPPELLEKLDQARRHVFGDRMDEAPPREGAPEESREPAGTEPLEAARAGAEAPPDAELQPQKKNGTGTQDA